VVVEQRVRQVVELARLVVGEALGSTLGRIREEGHAAGTEPGAGGLARARPGRLGALPLALPGHSLRVVSGGPAAGACSASCARLRKDCAVDVWRELVEDARWSPSPHNVQSWLVRPVDERHALLLTNPARLLPNTDPGSRFVTVGHGIFVESLSIAAAARRSRLDVGYEGRAAEDVGEPFATLTLVPAPVEEPLGVELLRARRTSRIPYDGRPAPDAVLSELTEIARAAGHTLRRSSDERLVADVLALNEDTLFYDMTDPVAREEVGGWLRFSADEAALRRDGFSPDALGFPGWLLRVFFRNRRLLEAPILRNAVRRLYRRTTRGTTTVAWLQGPFEEPRDWYAAGRLLQRLWLTMTARGVRLHPFGSIVTNAEANARAHALLELDPGEGIFWLVMRLGHSAEPPRSHRLETEQLVVA
jgi:hypothetical protein